MLGKKNIKLFIISGKARSGKGTISKIIENYYGDKRCITTSFGYYIKDYAKRIADWDGSEDTKPRQFLQEFGIELVKKQIDSKLFIRRILEDIEIFSRFYDIIIVNDARMLDEIESLKEAYPNSTLIRVKRDNFDNKLTSTEKLHSTETDLDNFNNFDYIIENNGDYEELVKKVNTILGGIK